MAPLGHSEAMEAGCLDMGEEEEKLCESKTMREAKEKLLSSQLVGG